MSIESMDQRIQKVKVGQLIEIQLVCKTLVKLNISLTGQSFPNAAATNAFRIEPPV